jgi:flagellar basal body-associated protein FliL
MDMNRVFVRYALLAMFAGCAPLLASNASAEDKSAKSAEKPADLENPASLAPYYDTLNKAKDSVVQWGLSLSAGV